MWLLRHDHLLQFQEMDVSLCQGRPGPSAYLLARCLEELGPYASQSY
jgi:hypothetical protein